MRVHSTSYDYVRAFYSFFFVALLYFSHTKHELSWIVHKIGVFSCCLLNLYDIFSDLIRIVAFLFDFKTTSPIHKQKIIEKES